jgi:iron complex outermembrane receptor protein
MKLKSTLVLSTAIALAFSVNVDPAVAQDDEYEDSVLEEVIVTGIRGSLQRSLDAKQRVPGVTISAASANEGAFDENDRVSMRGTSPSYTQTLINGHNIASGDWFVLNQTGTVGRSVSYSLLPAELVEQVIVRKAYEAKLVEGGITGSIDILTHGPLNFDEGITFSGNIGLVYADLPSETDPQLSALFNWKNDDATFGIMVQAFYQQRNLRRDGQEILGYNVIAGTDAAAVAYPELEGVFYPSLIGSALFEQERERIGGQVTVEWAPSDDWTITLDGFSSTLEAPNYNRNYMLWGSAIIGRGAVPDAGFVVRDNTLVEANFTADPSRQYGIYDEISRPRDESSSEYISAEAEWILNDRWTFSGQIGTSEGRGKTPTQDVAEWNTGIGTGAGWRLNGVGAADWNLGSEDTSQPGTPLEDVSLGWIFGYQDIDVEDSEDWLQLDGHYVWDRRVMSSIDFGVRFADHGRHLDQATAQGPLWSDSPFDPAKWPQDFSNYPSDFGSGISGSFPRDVWYHSPGDLADFNQYTDRDPVTRFHYPGVYGLDEETSAAYIQFNFFGERWSGNVGLRYVKTEEDITNYVNTTPEDPDAITTSAFGPYKPVRNKYSYNDWLPTLNVRWELTEDMYFRGAATRTMGRPDYSALAGSVSLLPPATEGGVGSGTGGNPSLEPILSTNLDLTWEWYYAERALLSASIFWMDIDNYVALGQEMVSIFTIDAQHPEGRFVDYLLTVPVNSDAEVKGFEISWQQPFGEHWGIMANYSYADGDTDDGQPMLGTSEHTYNLGGYFESDNFSARLAYNFRSEFYSGLDRASAFWQDDVKRLDASVGYAFGDHWVISLDGRNLTNETVEYFAESRERPRSIYENGRQYYLNLRFNY